MQRRMMIRGFFMLALLMSASCPVAMSQDLSRGHRILLKRGLQLQAMTFVPQTGYFDPVRWAESNFTAIDFCGAAYPAALMPPETRDMPWSRYMYYATDITKEELPYAPHMLRLQLRDEQDIGDEAELAMIAPAMAALQAKYPNAMIHTNQSGDSGTYESFTTEELQTYVRRIKPDLLMFDKYPYAGHDAGGAPLSFYQTLEKFRKLGLAGHDGTGKQPIPVGTYTQTFTYDGVLNHIVSESEVRLNNFAAWAVGCKLICSYFYEERKTTSESSVMFSGEGTEHPTAVFYHVAETNRQSLNLGPALIRLKSRQVAIKMGRYFYADKPVYNDLPVGVTRWDASQDPYITDINATNIGSLNHGLEGDVIVGYFQPLDPSFADPGHAEDWYFMVVNGLRKPKGSAAQCRQVIRLEFDFKDSGVKGLLRLSRDTGEVEEVTLVHKGGSRYYLDLQLDGGTADLFKFDNGATFVSKATQ
jgi:hypothetical protein